MARFLLALTILAIIIGGLYQTGALEGVSAPSLSGILVPNPDALDASANQDQASAEQKRAQAQAAREWSASATRTAAEERARMTQIAQQVIAQQTAQAQATQEQFAREVIGWTATADSANSTATMSAVQTVTMQANIIATQTAAVEQAKRERMAVMENFVNDFKMVFWPVIVPLVALIVLTVLALYGGLRGIRSKTGIVATHEHGVLYDKDQKTVIRPALQSTAVMNIKNPAQPTPVEQRIVDNHQKIGLARELARAQPGQALPGATGGFQVIPSGAVPPLLEDPGIVNSSMDEDWSKNGSAN